MKNILFMSYYRQRDGIGRACLDYAQAFIESQYNITLSNICGARTSAVILKDNEVPDFVTKYENNRQEKYDILIQAIQPVLYEKIGGVKNYGLMFVENFNDGNTYYGRKMNMMDGMFFTSDEDIERARTYGYTKRAIKLPVPANIDRYFQSCGKNPKIPQDSFNFYFIGDSVDRKNLIATLNAFHREFDTWENVNLIVKYGSGIFQNNPAHSLIRDFKKVSRIYHLESLYKKEIIIDYHLTNEEIDELHNSCHCLVSSSYGESWCRPAFDAMGFGKNVIITSGTGANEYLKDIGFMVKSHRVPVFTIEPPIEDIYNGNEDWLDIDVIDLQSKMRYVFENYNSEELKKIRINGVLKAKKYSYKSVGNLINGISL